jgi:vanillate O-demethylase ferredoxin subunit
MNLPRRSVEPERFEVVVAGVVPQTARVTSFELRDPTGAALPEFTAGAHVDVHLPNGLVRSYSLYGDARERDAYRIAVLREAGGSGGSAWMHERVRAGDTLTIAPPVNRFEIDEGGDEHILIAGGIGITPIMAMAYRLDELALSFRLHYCARSADDAAFAGEVTSRFGERVTMQLDGGDAARRIDLAGLLADRAPGSHVYVCGPRGLIDATRAAARHWPRGTVHFELFGTGAVPGAAVSDDRPFDVHLRRRRMDLTVPAGRSLLDVLLEAGVGVTAVCHEGFCGTCTTRYVAGNVDHRDGVLDDDERKSTLQVCVSRGRAGDTLVLDL